MPLIKQLPPTPKPPFQCFHPDKKGTNLLLFEFCIHLHTHQDLKCCKCMGRKLRYGRPCTYDQPSIHTWLAQPHIASIFSKFYLMLAQSWKFGAHCCSSGLTHPAACTRARVPQSFGYVHRPPFYAICSKRVAIDWALAEDSNDIINMLWKWPRKKLEIPHKRLKPRQENPSPLPN